LARTKLNEVDYDSIGLLHVTTLSFSFLTMPTDTLCLVLLTIQREDYASTGRNCTKMIK